MLEHKDHRIIKNWLINVKWRLGVQWEGRGMKRVLRMNSMEVCYIYAYEDSIMKTTKHLNITR
jgi:hypothetical protein